MSDLHDKKIKEMEESLGALRILVLGFMHISYEYMPPDCQDQLNEIGKRFNEMQDQIEGQPTAGESDGTP